jgi:hypothetical protein
LSLPSRLRLLRLLRRRPLSVSAFFVLAFAGLVIGLSRPTAPDPAALMASEPPAAGMPITATAAIAAPPLPLPPWPAFVDGRLLPDPALRRRFDALLISGSPDTAQAALLRAARAELPPAAAAEVLRLWQGYLQLQQQDWQLKVDLNRIETWDAALGERQTVRRERLGPDWAEAFYGDDERRLRIWMAEQTGTAASQPP